MKRILFYAALLSCPILGCKKTEKSSIIGIYQMEKQRIIGGGTDSTYLKTQIKIYTSHNFIYAGMTADSVVGFGVGRYKADTGNTIIEKEFYSSYRLDTSRNFKLLITMKDNGFSEKIPSIAVIKGAKYDLSEDYTRLTTGDSSKLDGLWKMGETIYVKGKDTSKVPVTQYKIFWGGHFLFAGRYPTDKTATKFKSTFGYGSFDLKGNDLSEEDQISNSTTVLNHKFKIKITFKGDAEYTQVIDDEKNQQQTIETYKRVD
jgi:hypothetical protein